MGKTFRKNKTQKEGQEENVKTTKKEKRCVRCGEKVDSNNVCSVCLWINK